MDKKIKILIACHKNSKVMRTDILQPIQVGCANSKVQFADMLHDNTGEQISSLNASYCELTAIYWAWKNLQADYYGLFHYRRYFDFGGKPRPADTWGNEIEPQLNDEAIARNGWSDARIRAVIADYDVVLPEKKNVSKMAEPAASVYKQYANASHLHTEDLALLLEILQEKYPEYLSVANAYFAGKETYLCNMFIMKKEVFFPYCEWLFAVLEEFRLRSDLSRYSVEGLRTPGHLAERLLNIYCLYQQQTHGLRCLELPCVVIENTAPKLEILPVAQGDRNIAIALSANNYYAPYVSVLLASLKAHAASRYMYDVLILTRDFSAQNQRVLRSQLLDSPNISLRFVDVSPFEHQFAHLFVRGHFSLETYFRLILPEILPAYEKVLYLDSDLVLQADPAALYLEELGDNLLAACHDPDTVGLYNGYLPHKKAYMEQVLKLNDPYAYFQAGVLVINLAQFRARYTSQQMLQFAASYQWELLDQDVLNYLAQGAVHYVDMAWNVMTDWQGIRVKDIIGYAPAAMQQDYRAARSAPKIIHYAGPDKPWQQADVDFADCFWLYARQSPLYEVILQRMCGGAPKAGAGAGFKKACKKVLKPIVNLLFPPYTKRRAWLEQIRSRL